MIGNAEQYFRYQHSVRDKTYAAVLLSQTGRKLHKESQIAVTSKAASAIDRLIV